jgi:Peptidase family M23
MRDTTMRLWRSVIRSFASAVALCTTLAASAADKPAAVRLSTLPGHVYRIADPGKFETESWYFELVVHDSRGRNWTADALEIESISSGRVLKTTLITAPALESRRRRVYFPTPDMHRMSMRRHFSIPDEAFSLPLIFSERRADAISHVRLTLTLRSATTLLRRSTVLPIERYVQKTKLIFPFRGPGIVTQGHFNDGGHAHRQTLFAIDVMALTLTYAPMLSEEERNETVAGWGKEIIAPAAGTVVHARNDVPTNPLYAPDEAAYSALDEPIWAMAGNSVVIDHGNGEFSALMHLQGGSVTVKKGDSVAQGQVVGKLGNSGDSYMPHLHYQLTTGPLLFASDGLPVQFENLPETVFTRGTYFTAR